MTYRLSLSGLLVLLIAACQTAQSPAPPPNPSRLADRSLCARALSDDDFASATWSSREADQIYVSDARRRQFTKEDCFDLLAIPFLRGSGRAHLIALDKALASQGLTDKSLKEAKDGEELSISDLIKNHNPNLSMWAGRAWGHGGSKPKLSETQPVEPTSDQVDEAREFVEENATQAEFSRMLLRTISKKAPETKLLGDIPPSDLQPLLVQSVKSVPMEKFKEWQNILTDVFLEKYSIAAAGHTRTRIGIKAIVEAVNDRTGDLLVDTYSHILNGIKQNLETTTNG